MITCNLWFTNFREHKVVIWLAALYFFEVSGMPQIFTDQNALEDESLDIPLGTPDMVS